jgi:cytochrome aa3-600 menaquinol oxidase subunit 1
MIAISALSFLVWVHHFYTMGQGSVVNGFFSITTMAISIPTGVKIFNWLFTLRKGKIEFTVPMLYSLAFIPIFTIGGVTGVMLAMASADYQYHNTMFLVAHFHYVLIPGTVFAVIAGFYYWFPKVFGFKLDEKIGKITFWTIIVSFNVTFFPLFLLGLKGMTRRTYTYSAESGFGPLNMIATIGAVGLAIGFMLLVYNIYYSVRYAPRETTGDPWNARTLEWATSSPIAPYNFAVIPKVDSLDPFWKDKKEGKSLLEGEITDIHMPSNSGIPFILGAAFMAFGFFLIFEWWVPMIVFAVPIALCLIARSFQRDHGFHIHKEEIIETEKKLRGDHYEQQASV